MTVVNAVVMAQVAQRQLLIFHIIVMQILQVSNLMFQVRVLQVHLVVQQQMLALQFLHLPLLF